MPYSTGTTYPSPQVALQHQSPWAQGLAHCPPQHGYTHLPSVLFRVTRQLWIPLVVVDSACALCGEGLDKWDDHAAAIVVSDTTLSGTLFSRPRARLRVRTPSWRSQASCSSRSWEDLDLPQDPDLEPEPPRPRRVISDALRICGWRGSRPADVKRVGFGGPSVSRECSFQESAPSPVFTWPCGFRSRGRRLVSRLPFCHGLSFCSTVTSSRLRF